MSARARAILALLVFLLFLAGCGRKGHEAPQGGANVPPSKVRLKRNVDLTRVRQQKMTSFVETVGFLDAEGQPDVAAGVSGIVEEVLFREGDWVVADQTILVKIDQGRYKAMLDQAEANWAKAKANIIRVKAVVKKSAASIRDAEQTLDMRRVMLDNIRRAGRSVKSDERQEAQANHEVAIARLDVAKAEQLVSEAELSAAIKEADAASALYDLAMHNFKRSQVRAPYTGRINQRKVARGTYLEDKSVIATMADLRRLRLVGYVPESSAAMVRQMLRLEDRTRIAYLVGSTFASSWSALSGVAADHLGETPAVFPLEFTLRAFPDHKFLARLFFLSTVASPDTHLFECKAEVSLRGLGQELRPGFTAKIRCPLPGRPTTIVVPEESVRASERGFIAFRPRAVPNKDGKLEYFAEAVSLELGQREPGFVEVLKGLRPGDWVVQKGAEALEDNTPLAIPEAQLKELQNATGPLLGVSRVNAP